MTSFRKQPPWYKRLWERFMTALFGPWCLFGHHRLGRGNVGCEEHGYRQVALDHTPMYVKQTTRVPFKYPPPFEISNTLAVPEDE